MYPRGARCSYVFPAILRLNACCSILLRSYLESRGGRFNGRIARCGSVGGRGGVATEGVVGRAGPGGPNELGGLGGVGDTGLKPLAAGLLRPGLGPVSLGGEGATGGRLTLIRLSACSFSLRFSYLKSRI